MSMQNDSGQEEEEVFEWKTWGSASNANPAVILAVARTSIAQDRANTRSTTRTRVRTRKAPLHQ